MWNSLRWYYTKDLPMPEEFDPINGTLIQFVKGKVRVNLRTAIEALPDPFTFNEKTGVLTEKQPSKLHYLIFGQFIWVSRTPIQIYDLELALYYDEKCEHEVSWVSFQFPKKPIENGKWFPVRVTITKNPEFIMLNMLQQPTLQLQQAAKPIMEHPDWDSWFKQQPKDILEAWYTGRQFHVKICGMASEG